MSATMKRSAEPLALAFDKPATVWTEALPLGNGSLGAMVFGGVEKERLQLNEESLWLGDETQMGSYQPLGDLFLEFPHTDISHYTRRLSLDDALHTVSYTANGVHYQREAFISFPAQVLVLCLTADKPATLSFSLHLTDSHGGMVTPLGFLGALENGLTYDVQVRVLTDGGMQREENGKLVVSGATSATVLLAAGTSFANDPRRGWRGDQPKKKLEQRLTKAAKLPYETLKAAHLKYYQALYQRVTFELPRSAGEGGQRAALFFQYGRYLLIASSRPGGLPANLQGIWNADLKPAWYSGYTTDINVQMNYWLAETTNLAECHAPLFDWIENLAFVRKKNAQPALATDKGWLIYSTNNPMGGNSTWAIHRPGSAWLSQHLWERFAFSGDTKFLRERAYPVLRELTEYWEGHLVEDKNGALVTPDGWSPEHGPVKGEGDRTTYPGVSYDQQLVWDLFTNFIEASEVLGKDAAYRKKIQGMRQKLLGPQVGKWGQLQEWAEDLDNPKDQHRHVSHLFAVHPGRQITPITTPALAQAARVSLNARGDGGTGWSKAWKICFWARLGDGDRAYALLQSLLTPTDGKRGGVYPNLFDAHPPFQIDGNFGATAGMTELLLQSHTGELHLLPALPHAWPEGSVTGLRARGGFTVDIAWAAGALTHARIRADKAATCRVRYGTKQYTKALRKGESFTFPLR